MLFNECHVIVGDRVHQNLWDIKWAFDGKFGSPVDEIVRTEIDDVIKWQLETVKTFVILHYNYKE